MLKYYLLICLLTQLCVCFSQETTTSTSTGNWNEVSLWSNGLPDENKTAIIGKNTTVSITGDHSANNVVVHGTLDVQENGAAAKSLSTNWIHVNSGGVFQIGSEQNRFDESKFTLTLTGTNADSDQIVPMANGMTMNIQKNDGFLMAGGGGRLQFFGAEKLSFTKLSQTADVGENTITVANIIDRDFDDVLSANTDGEVNWEVGDEIVIASSSTTYTDEDVRTITAVQNLGETTRFTLDRPLDFKHYGEIETYGINLDPLSIPIKGGARSIDLRAEVALLSRNVVIKGTEIQDTDTFLGDRANLQLQSDGKAANGVGGHVMIMPTAGQITVDGVQLHLMGQAGRLGRYPFHWHIARDRNGDVLKNSSITNSNNRAVVVHATDNVLVEGIVAHDIHGHGFFTEDGVELNNTFLNNIAFSVHRVHPDNDRPGAAAFVVDDTDTFFDRGIRARTTAAFWIANAGNNYIGNVVAGCEGSGIWFGQPARPRGASANIGDYINFRPRETPLATFDHNTVHSSTTGFVVVIEGVGSENGIGGAFNENERMFGNIDPEYNNLTIYSSGIGLYPLVSNVRHIFKNFKAADNNYFSWDSDPNLIKDGLLVIRSRGNLNTSGNEVTGIALYHGNTIIEDCHIAGVGGRFFVGQGGGNRVRSGAEVGGLTYEDDGSYLNMNSVQPSSFATIRDVYDRDGTLTTPYGGGPGYSFMGGNEWTLNPSLGDRETEPNNRFKAMLSKHRFMNLETPSGRDPALENSTPRILLTSPQGVVREMVIRDHFNQRRASLRIGNEYQVDFPDGFDPDVNNLVLSAHQWSMPSNSVGVILKFVDQADNIKPQNRASKMDISRVNTIDDLRAASVDSYFTASDNNLYVKIMNRGVGIHGNWISFTAVGTTSCEDDAETITEYFLDGNRVEGEEVVAVPQGRTIRISGYPDTNNYTITKPDGTSVDGDFTIDRFISGMDGKYVITNQFGCAKNLFVKLAPTLVNHIAKGKPAIQSSGTTHAANLAVDGDKNAHTRGFTFSATDTEVGWWRVDLQNVYDISAIAVTSRYDFRPERINGAKLYVGTVDSTDPNDYTEIAMLDDSSVTTNFQGLNVTGRYVLIHQTIASPITLAEVEVYGNIVDMNINHTAIGKPVSQSSTYLEGAPERAVDGNLNGVFQDGSVSSTTNEINSWWRVDLEGLHAITDINIHNRTDCCGTRVNGVSLYVGNIDSTDPADYTKIGDLGFSKVNKFSNLNILGRYIMLRHNGEGSLAIAEVEVHGVKDSDGDGVPDAMDSCPDTPAGTSVNAEGCDMFFLPSDNFSVSVVNESCSDSNDGQVIIAAATPLDYTATLSKDGEDFVKEFDETIQFDNLASGTYQLCFTIAGQPSFMNCSELMVTSSEPLRVTTSINETNKLIVSLSGAETYTIELNDETHITTESEIELELNPGENTLSVSTDIDCQGENLQTILVDGKSIVYPNPVPQGGVVNIRIGNQHQEVVAILLNSSGLKVLQKLLAVKEGHTELIIDNNISDGSYILLIVTKNYLITHKLIVE